MGALWNAALSVIEIGSGLSLQGSVLSAAGGTSTRATRLVAINYVLASTDYYIGYTGTGGNTITLPDAATLSGGEYIIKNRGTGTLTISAPTGAGLFTTTAASSISLLAGESIHIISDGQYWDVVAMASGIIVP